MEHVALDLWSWSTVFVDEVKGKLSDTCVDHYFLLSKYLSNHMHFITYGYKLFSKTNSTDQRQCVPLKSVILKAKTNLAKTETAWLPAKIL